MAAVLIAAVQSESWWIARQVLVMLGTSKENDFDLYCDSFDNATHAEMTPGVGKPVDNDLIANLLATNSATKRKQDTREAQASAAKMKVLTNSGHESESISKKMYAYK